MKFVTAGHRFGNKIVPTDIQEEIAQAISNAKTSAKKRASSNIKTEILESLQAAGWSSEVELDPTSRITITSCKKKVGLVFQTGNMARMYADLLKLQALYSRETIMAAVFILPSYKAAKELGSNIVNFDRLKNELTIFERVITVPIKIYGFE